MKRLRFQSGYGNGVAVIGSGQVLSISMIPNSSAPNEGSYLSINQSKPIFVPAGSALNITAQELGAYVGEPMTDWWPGDGDLTIVFGAEATPPPDVIPNPPIGGPPVSWLVIHNGR